MKMEYALFKRIKIKRYININNSMIKFGQCITFNTYSISVIGVVNDKKYKQETAPKDVMIKLRAYIIASSLRIKYTGNKGIRKGDMGSSVIFIIIVRVLSNRKLIGNTYSLK
jgi:hypothetical protein